MINTTVKKLQKIHHNIYSNIFGIKNYGKFVVITRSRTGSNLLISLLNSNPKIIAHGEKFSLLGHKNCDQIYKEIFPKKSNKIVGFKLFYYHPNDSEDKSIWNTLKNNQSIKIIHLQRKNLLRSHISRLIAGKTENWASTQAKETGLKEKQIHIDTEKLLSDFETTNNYIKETNEAFKNHRTIEIFYEDLVNDRKKTIKRISNFLEVEDMDLKSNLKKQNQEKIKEIVLNYEELYECLINTKHSHMLQE